MATKMNHMVVRGPKKFKRLNNKSLGAKVIQEMVRKIRSKDFLIYFLLYPLQL
jgi:hypothetical protein